MPPNNDHVRGANDHVRGASAPLTPLQYRFMRVLQKRLSDRPGVGPTYEELRVDLGLASKSGVARLVAACEERGRIARLPNRDRSLAVLVPVPEEGHPGVDILQAFSDRELLAEIQKRGLLSLVAS